MDRGSLAEAWRQTVEFATLRSGGLATAQSADADWKCGRTVAHNDH
jgi:hypothetical protein